MHAFLRSVTHPVALSKTVSGQSHAGKQAVVDFYFETPGNVVACSSFENLLFGRGRGRGLKTSRLPISFKKPTFLIFICFTVFFLFGRAFPSVSFYGKF